MSLLDEKGELKKRRTELARFYETPLFSSLIEIVG